MKHTTLLLCAVITGFSFGSTLHAGQTYGTFDQFLKHYSATAHLRDSALTQFWTQAQQEGIPWIDSTGTAATFLYRGQATSVKVQGDFTGWNFQLPLKRLGDSNLFYLTLVFEPDARLDYLLTVDGKEQIDPRNPRTTTGGYGDRSELAMPGFQRSVMSKDFAASPKGSLRRTTHTSKILGYSHTVFVYLPAGYEDNKAAYPVIYFQDGADYINYAKAPTILDNMIAASQLPPVIGVFVVPPTDAHRNRKTEYSLNNAYASFFASELVPFVDRTYRTIPDSSARILVGDSRGGAISLYTAFLYPDTFANVATQSANLTLMNDTLQTMFETSAAKPLRIYLDVGTYEKNVGGFPPGSNDGNFHGANRNFRRILIQKDYDYHYREYPDGHSWGRWKNELPYLLRWFFPETASQ